MTHKIRPRDVSDHAVLRYLERGLGVDVEGLRKRIAKAAQTAADHNAEAAIVDGLRFRVSACGRVVTVVALHGAKISNRARRLRRRLK